MIACALSANAAPARAQEADPWFGEDKALHFAVSAGLAGAGYGVGALCFEARAPRFALGVGLALTAGIGKELYDLAGHGDPSWRDLAWDALGTGVGVLVAWLIDRAVEGATSNARPRRAAVTLLAGPGRVLLAW